LPDFVYFNHAQHVTVGGMSNLSWSCWNVSKSNLLR
jgi:hypothetical protein